MRVTVSRSKPSAMFETMLTAQDQGTKVLHITVQNKVSAEAARALQAELGPMLMPRRFAFAGLGLHLYHGPHWEAVGIWPFRGRASADTRG